MKIRPAMIPALVLSLGLLFAGEALGQRPADVDAFYRGVADHFDLPVEEVRILSEWQITPEEVPVVLFLARRAGVSPDALVALKRGNTGWWSLAERYHLNARVFHVPLPESTAGGSLSRAYQAYRDTPTERWAEVRLSDRDLVGLVNLRFVSDYLGLPPDRVLSSADRAGSWVSSYAELARRP